MKNKCKGLSIFLAIIIITAVTTTGVFSAETYLEYKGFTYTRESFENKTIKIYSYNGSATNLDIDAELADLGWSVESIASNAFSNHTELTSVVIPDTTKTIFNSAFAGCNNIDKIVIPASTTEIYTNAFRDCSSATQISIAGSITSVSDYTFFGCSSVSNVVLPESVKTIGVYAFYGCTDLEKIYIPNTTTFVAPSAFSNCPNVTIYGGYNSYAQSYAKENNIPYVAIDEEYCKLGELIDTANVMLNSSIKYTSLSYEVATKQNIKAQELYNLPFSENTDYKTTRYALATALSNLKDVTKINLGDVDDNGKVNLKDIYLLQSYTADSAELSFDQQQLSDVNNDGKINVLDSQLIQMYVTEMIDHFPI